MFIESYMNRKERIKVDQGIKVFYHSKFCELLLTLSNLVYVFGLFRIDFDSWHSYSLFIFSMFI